MHNRALPLPLPLLSNIYFTPKQCTSIVRPFFPIPTPSPPFGWARYAKLGPAEQREVKNRNDRDEDEDKDKEEEEEEEEDEDKDEEEEEEEEEEDTQGIASSSSTLISRGKHS